MESNTQGIIAALISTASWALSSILLKKMGEKLEPIGMTTIKSMFSFVFLLFFILLVNKSVFIPQNLLIPILFSGVIGISIGDSLFFASLNRLSPFVLSLLLFVGPDLLTGLFGYILLKEFPSLFQWIAIILILLGLGFFIFPIEKQNETKETQNTFVGIFLAIMSLICTSYSMVIIKPVLQTVSTITVTMYRMFFSATALIIIGILTKKIFLWKTILSDKKYCIQLTGTMGLVTFGGFWLSLVAIRNCQLIIASTLMSLEPLFIIIFMILFCKYKLKRKEIFGILLTVLGIFFISFK